MEAVKQNIRFVERLGTGTQQMAIRRHPPSTIG